MQITFVDTPDSWSQMLPISYTRPVADTRVGILKISEKWSRRMGNGDYSFRTETYLQDLFQEQQSKSLCILGSVLPSTEITKKIQSLKEDEVITHKDQLIAGYFSKEEPFESGNRTVVGIDHLDLVQYPWDIFRLNGQEIKADFELITSGRQSEELQDPYAKVYGSQLFLEEGAKVKAAILNTENGPIYLGKNAEVQEGAVIRGPFSLGENAVVNVAAKIRGDSSVGPFSKVGGEISNSVILGYSNKGHDGFLGNSVIGEWCNIGADSNNSNLKNNYTHVKMWDFNAGKFKDTGLQFCGLIMGDHSKCGINTMFNTGTTVGVAANIFGHGFPRNFIPSFAWGGASGFTTYQLKKAIETAELVTARRNKILSDGEKSILTHIFKNTSSYRVWENK
ncbi:MAG: GlmU family protein [Bacteroidota bacterium]